MLERDRHVTRTGSDYADAMSRLLPQGIAWPREVSSLLMQVVRGLTNIWGFVETRASDLLERESDPRIALELLPDWERNWGLPDPCYEAPQTIGERQKALVQRMTIVGEQSRQFFIDAAAYIGYHITINEYRPFMVGIDRCGDNRLIATRVYVDTLTNNKYQAPPGVHGSWALWSPTTFTGSGAPGSVGGAVVGDFYMDTVTYPPYNVRHYYTLASTGPQVWTFAGNMILGEGAPTNDTKYLDQFGNPLLNPRGVLAWDNEYSAYPYVLGPITNRYYWTVHVDTARLTWFRVGGGGGQTGIDPHLRIGLALDLECLLNKWKPAHTQIIFDYSGLTVGGSMAGTP